MVSPVTIQPDEPFYALAFGVSLFELAPPKIAIAGGLLDFDTTPLRYKTVTQAVAEVERLMQPHGDVYRRVAVRPYFGATVSGSGSIVDPLFVFVEFRAVGQPKTAYDVLSTIDDINGLIGVKTLPNESQWNNGVSYSWRYDVELFPLNIVFLEGTLVFGTKLYDLSNATPVVKMDNKAMSWKEFGMVVEMLR